MQAEVLTKSRRGTCLGCLYIFILIVSIINIDKEKKGYLFSSRAKDMIKGENAILTHRHPAPALLCTPSDQSVG